MSNLVVQGELTKDQMALIKSTVAKGASDDELKLFLYRCKHMGLDPLKPGQIHFVKYGNNPGAMIIGIDGFRSRAASTGKHTGTKRGVIRDDNGKCIGSWCEVYRSDWTQCAREEVSLVEYNTGKSNWQKMPETMIKKVAEVAALRMAFPDELGGMYSDDEMDQAKPVTEVKNVLDDLKKEKEAIHNDPGLYVVTFGKYRGKSLKEIDMFELDNYKNWVIESANQNGKEIKDQVKVFIDTAEAYLSSLEVDTPIDDHDDLDKALK